MASTDPEGLMMVEGSGAGGGQQKSTTLRHLYALYDLRVLQDQYSENPLTARRWKASTLKNPEIDMSTLAAGGKGAVNFWAGYADSFTGFVGLHVDQPFHGPGLTASYNIGQVDAFACSVAAGAWELRAVGAAQVGATGSRPVAQVVANRAAGNAFRDAAAKRLAAEGYEIVDTEVRVNTAFGARVTDILARRNGTLVGFETKLGGSRYLPSQIAKDTYINRWGGTLVDGSPVQYPTLLMRGGKIQ